MKTLITWWFDVSALVLGACLLTFLLGSLIYDLYVERKEREKEEEIFLKDLEDLYNKDYAALDRNNDK